MKKLLLFTAAALTLTLNGCLTQKVDPNCKTKHDAIRAKNKQLNKAGKKFDNKKRKNLKRKGYSYNADDLFVPFDQSFETVELAIAPIEPSEPSELTIN